MEDWDPISLSIRDRDILSTLVPKLDEKILEVLYYSSLKDNISFILKTNDYWYEKTMYLTGLTLKERPRADWKKIYHNTKELLDNPEREREIILGDLNTLLVNEELYGPINIPSADNELVAFINTIRDPDVLTYLIHNRGLNYLPVLWTAINTNLESKNKKMVDALISLIPENQEKMKLTISPIKAIIANYLDIFKILFTEYSDIPNDGLGFILNTAARYSLDILQYLLENVSYTEEQISHAMEQSVLRDNTETLSFLMKRVIPNENKLDELLAIALENDSINTLKILDELMHIDWDNRSELIEASIAYESVNIVRYILSRMSQDKDLYPILKYSIEYDDRDIFELILHDPRSNLIGNLTDLVTTLIRDVGLWERRSVLRLIMLDPRIKTEELSPYLTNIILRELTDASTFSLVKGTDDYSLILTQIIFKRQSGSELMDWIIELGLRDAIDASSSVLNTDIPYTQEVAPIRALLICLLYPRMTLESQLSYLKKEGYQGEVLTKSIRMIALYLSSRQKRS